MGRLDVQQEHSRLGGHLLGKALRLPINLFKDYSFSVSRHQLFYLLHISESYNIYYLSLFYSGEYCWKERYSFIRSLKKKYREA